MKIRTIIIEDEEPARILLKNFLSSFKEIEFSGEFADGFSGLKAINELKPDLIFLDIQMPKLTGFEILELTEHKPIIIFTTAYDHYAIKAFEANATDYLLKPFTSKRFEEAVKKAINKFQNNDNDVKNIKSVLKSIDERPEQINRIALRSGSKIHVISVDDIMYIEADGDYVKIHIKDASYLKEKTMKFFESHLNSKQFIRIHRSYIVNVDQIQRLEYYDKENYIAVLKNNEHLKVSSNGYKSLRESLKL